MKCHLFLASTPLNMLTSTLIACTEAANAECLLAVIDQPGAEPHRIFSWLQECPGTPFSSFEVVSFKARGIRAKLAGRKSAFAKLDQLWKTWQPVAIYTGNDRRMEFQYAMHSKPVDALGIYMDDGTYSYVGKKSSWLGDAIVDNGLKKLVYGGWWRQPEDIGGSSWINEAWLFRPEIALPHLQSLPCHPLPAMHEVPFMQTLGRHALQDFKIDTGNLQGLRQLILIPHESVLTPATSKLITEYLNQADHNSRLAVKTHPRSAKLEDRLEKSMANHECLPSSVPLELLLPFFNDCRIIGERSTVLLTARWMRPDLRVASLDQGADKHWQQLLADNSITTVNSLARLVDFLNNGQTALHAGQQEIISKTQ